MSTPITFAQTSAVLNMLTAYANSIKKKIDVAPTFDFLKSSDVLYVQNIQSNQITWLQDNAFGASQDSTLADKWYTEAKSAESALADSHYYQYDSSLGSVDSILGRGATNSLGDSFTSYLPGPLAQVVSFASDTISSGASTAKAGASSAVSSVGNAVSSAASAVGSGVKNAVSGAFGLVPWYVWVGGAAVIAIVGYAAVKGGRVSIGT